MIKTIVLLGFIVFAFACNAEKFTLPVDEEIEEAPDLRPNINPADDIQVNLDSAAGGVFANPDINPTELITKENFSYLGAFRVPDKRNNGTRFGFGGRQLAFRPEGDPEGTQDGFFGSLFTVGHAHHQMVAELGIPEPMISPNKIASDLNTAPFINGFTEMTNGLGPILNKGNGWRVGGLYIIPQQIATPSCRLYWNAYRYYNVAGEDLDSLGCSNVNLGDPQARGRWHIGERDSDNGNFHVQKTAGYIFAIPDYWAEENLGGSNYLASGLTGVPGQGTSSAGPAIYAYKPWQLDGGTPPEQGREIMAVEILRYPNKDGKKLDQHNLADRWHSGIWLTTETRSAAMFCGSKSLGEVYYGPAKSSDACSQAKGYHGDPYETQCIFYDPKDLAAVVKGERESWQVQPYYRWSPTDFFPTCFGHITGAALDHKNNILYIVQPGADDDPSRSMEKYPLIHAFKIHD